jgi:hypothetical protein
MSAFTYSKKRETPDTGPYKTASEKEIEDIISTELFPLVHRVLKGDLPNQTEIRQSLQRAEKNTM